MQTAQLSAPISGDLFTIGRHVLKLFAPLILDIADFAKHWPGIAAGHVPMGQGAYFITAIDQFGPFTLEKNGWLFPEFLQVGYYENHTAIAWYHLRVTQEHHHIKGQWHDSMGLVLHHDDVCTQLIRSQLSVLKNA